jgi:hypothetical protein
MGLGDKVRKLDIFKKVPTDLSEGTNRGGFLSLLALISIVYFLIVEIQDYLSPQYNAMIVPDKLVTRKEMKYVNPYSEYISISSYHTFHAKSFLSISKTP